MTMRISTISLAVGGLVASLLYYLFRPMRMRRQLMKQTTRLIGKNKPLMRFMARRALRQLRAQ